MSAHLYCIWMAESNLSNRDNHASKRLFSSGVHAGKLRTKIIEYVPEEALDTRCEAYLLW
jgi:hypothetical protein